MNFLFTLLTLLQTLDIQKRWVWWILALAFALIGCGLLIHQVYNKWDQSPVIVTFSGKSTPVFEIPFPAVTICPETKANKTMIDFTKAYHKMRSQSRPPYNISGQELKLKYMEALSQICEPHLTDTFIIGDNATDTTIIDILKEIAPTFNETMHLCKFRNSINYCNDYFKEIMTDEGLCFTFNMLNARELYREGISKAFLKSDHSVVSNWNIEPGYQESRDPEIYPYRVLAAGARSGLFVLLRSYEQHLDYICKGPVQGFKILLHHPGEIPQLSKEYFRVPLLQEVLVSVKPNMMTTSVGLLDYASKRRQCFFGSEKFLRFFKVYTQRNCELECLANYTLKTCGCVRFSMPRVDDTPICGHQQMNCYYKAEHDLLHEQYLNGITNNSSTLNECLPACISIKYDAEISQSSYDWNLLLNAFNIPSEHPRVRPARLAIFFKENQFITTERSELYGQTDFLANCGGLLGLFMGVSLLSIVEIIYHVTLRLCCNLRKIVSSQDTTYKINLKPLSENKFNGTDYNKHQ